MSAATVTLEPVFQSTPACGGRPTPTRVAAHGCHDVSIHARVRRATVIDCATPQRMMFQSTPAYGGRPIRDRAHRSCDIDVSIHARVRRATSRCGMMHRHQLFQSTPACGGRPYRTPSSPAVIVFQSTPACGGRRSAAIGRRGRQRVSIHARVRRATRSSRWPLAPCDVSIHARVRRATHGRHAAVERSVSIHARVRRATLNRHAQRAARHSFQSTPAYGGRRCSRRHMR